jgi:uracil-DNA glycosylase family 4
LAVDLTVLNNELTACVRCERLTVYRERIGREKRRAYIDHEYWAKPVPGFGDTKARVLVLGLAPGAHGSNRTGRPFTGDGSGNFLYPVLYETGFASQPMATAINDGMKLKDMYITSVVKCAPPQNKPLPEEIVRCAPFLDSELQLLKRVRVVVALGKIGFDGYISFLKRQGCAIKRADFPFGHAVEYEMPNGIILLGSYHPSLQNTNTGKLTKAMFSKVFRRARQLCV